MTAHHFPHYVALLGIFVCAIIGFSLFPWDRVFQLSVVIATSASYVAWGIVHHFLHDDLYFEVVVEYVSIALLGTVIGITLLI